MMLKIKFFLTCIRILTRNTICSLRVMFIYALPFWKSTKRWDISCLSCLFHIPFWLRITLRASLQKEIIWACWLVIFEQFIFLWNNKKCRVISLSIKIGTSRTTLSLFKPYVIRSKFQFNIFFKDIVCY